MLLTAGCAKMGALELANDRDGKAFQFRLTCGVWAILGYPTEFPVDM